MTMETPSILLRHQFKAADVVVITHKHPVHGFCGFGDHIKGTRAVIEAEALTEYQEPAWRLQFNHPISMRLCFASVPAACLEPADYDRLSYMVENGKMTIFMHKGDKLRGESVIEGPKAVHPFGNTYKEILACVTGQTTGILQVCGLEIKPLVKQ